MERNLSSVKIINIILCIILLIAFVLIGANVNAKEVESINDDTLTKTAFELDTIIEG